jgi:carbon monoxide dehydrogenase subunit G
MHFEGEFHVPGKAADVIQRFADVPRMAKCMPGAMLEPQAEDRSWPGAMVVRFGPKKIAFKGKATCVFDNEALTGKMTGRGTADMRAARIGVNLTFALSDVPETTPPRTSVKIVSDAELGGVLADFAKTGGVAVANAIMTDFARRVSEEFSKDDPPPAALAAGGPNAATAPTLERGMAEPAAPLQAGSLLWLAIKAYLTRLLRLFR